MTTTTVNLTILKYLNYDKFVALFMGKRFLHYDSCFWFSNYWFSVYRIDYDEFW